MYQTRLDDRDAARAESRPRQIARCKRASLAALDPAVAPWTKWKHWSRNGARSSCYIDLSLDCAKLASGRERCPLSLRCLGRCCVFGAALLFLPPRGKADGPSHRKMGLKAARPGREGAWHGERQSPLIFVFRQDDVPPAASRVEEGNEALNPLIAATEFRRRSRPHRAPPGPVRAGAIGLPGTGASRLPPRPPAPDSPRSAWRVR